MVDPSVIVDPIPTVDLIPMVDPIPIMDPIFMVNPFPIVYTMIIGDTTTYLAKKLTLGLTHPISIVTSNCCIDNRYHLLFLIFAPKADIFTPPPPLLGSAPKADYSLLRV